LFADLWITIRAIEFGKTAIDAVLQLLHPHLDLVAGEVSCRGC
jgi:hypothetical protein